MSKKYNTKNQTSQIRPLIVTRFNTCLSYIVFTILLTYAVIKSFQPLTGLPLFISYILTAILLLQFLAGFILILGYSVAIYKNQVYLLKQDSTESNKNNNENKQ